MSSWLARHTCLLRPSMKYSSEPRKPCVRASDAARIDLNQFSEPFAALHMVWKWHLMDTLMAFSNVRFGGKPDIEI
jgi:hypothetical protein